MFMPATPKDPVPAALYNGVAAIGNFDGVHRGHQVVLAATLKIARASSSPALALTFEPHPRTHFKPDAPVFRLTMPAEKLAVLEAMGLDGAVVRNFANMAPMPPEEFIEKLIVRGLQASHIVVGEGFHFGKDRAGTPDVLRALAEKAGIGVTFVPPQRDGEIISSSLIRDELTGGVIARANNLLGYRWFVGGRVIHGDKRGRSLGVPTANLVMADNFSLKHGVYAGRVCADGAWFTAAIHFGTRVQFGGGPPLLEVHLLDFSGDLYGKRLRVEFMEFLRGEQKFADTAALMRQMQADIARARLSVAAAVKKPQSPLQTALDQACETQHNT